MAQKYLRKIKVVTRLCKRIARKALLVLNKQIIYLLRTISGTNRRRGALLNEGFVLPTVVLVSLVVVLLTTAILFRAFDRSKNASNVRVNEIVMRAAAPAIDRAKAKINQLFIDPRLPRSTPSDTALTQVMEGNISSYTFADETQLRLYYPIDSTYQINGSSSGTSTDNNINTAWKYPVDTDGDGKFDSFTLYGIYFRTPEQTRPRTPLESRAEPMNEGITSTSCTTAIATSANLVGTQGWYQVGSKLKRSIFVYTINVPITDITTPNLDQTKFELFNGNKGFSALEYQQDRERLPLTNNAVIYDNDLQISPGAGLKLNGRISTNGNLLTGAPTSGTTNGINFYLVSSPSSCYYKQENSKIVVGGNVINSNVNSTTAIANATTLDLFDSSVTTSTSTSLVNTSINIKTVPTAIYGAQGAYNDYAYSQRINKLVSDATTKYSISPYPGQFTNLPQEVQTGITNELSSTYGVTGTTASASQLNQAEQDQLTIYFQKTTRRVPYAEVALVPASGGNTPLKRNTAPTYDYSGSNSSIQGSGDTSGNPLRPVDAWVYPFINASGSTNDGSTASYTGIGVSVSTSPNLNFPATDSTILATTTPYKELKIGDRIWVGNGLPQYWLANTSNNSSASTNAFINSQLGQSVSTGENIYQPGTTNPYLWDGSTTTTRQRYSQSYHLDNLGDTGRNGFWEVSAAENANGSLDVIGGLRVVTGAGIYLPNDYVASSHSFTKTQTVVWPDSMPTGISKGATPVPTSFSTSPSTSASQYGLPNDKTPYLQMRATAVYHYLNSYYDPNVPTNYQKPLACVSSLYDPTNSSTARNSLYKGNALPDVSPLQAINSTPSYSLASNNSLGRALTGVSTVPTASVGNSNNGVVYAPAAYDSAYLPELQYQAGLTYPNSNQINNGSSNPYYTSTTYGSAAVTTNANGGGRLVNPLLASALTKIANSTNLTLAEQSAVDSAMCALKILDTSIGSPSDTYIPHGAIMETTFLDARQVKAVDKNSTVAAEIGIVQNSDTVAMTAPYDLDVEFRQPLEIRATVLDLDLLRRNTTATTTPDGTTEYLLPNAGIIYATRDDALADNSYGQDPNPLTNISNTSTVGSNASDFIVDPTRRPNGILLVHGSKISRGTSNNYIAAEKGLTLASNLPVYLQADTTSSFNHHTNQEYTTLLTSSTWANFYTRTSSNFDPNFACRANQFNPNTCNIGETWRPATILADSITVLSNNFQLGYRSDGDYGLRDNYGNNPVGYDFNNSGNAFETATFSSLGYSLDETALQFDVDGDGSISNTSVTKVYENTLGVDINSNGQLDTTAVDITEANITATVAARLNGFWDNSFVTSHSFTDSNYSGTSTVTAATSATNSSSYFNNGITPIQRRVKFSEYLMEMCPKLTVTACNPGDWVVGYDTNGDHTFSLTEQAITANQLLQMFPTGGFNEQQLWSGTTAQPAAVGNTLNTYGIANATPTTAQISQQQVSQTYPRRVAFLRYDGTVITAANVTNKTTNAVLNTSPVTNALVLDSDSTPVPIGIKTAGATQNMVYYPFTNTLNIKFSDTLGTPYAVTPAPAPYSTSNQPNTPNNALWFRTSNSGTPYSVTGTPNYSNNYPLWIPNFNRLTVTRATEQPLLIPVLQIQFPTQPSATTLTPTSDGGNTSSIVGNWFQVATTTEANAVFAQGDSPGRPPGLSTTGTTTASVTTTKLTKNIGPITITNLGESGGGLENFVRYLENWNNVNSTIAGSFIQFKRSSFATAPYQTIINASNAYSGPGTTSIFSYGQGYHTSTNGSGFTGFYYPPNRLWGYDVALLTQLPDLFSQRFTSPSLNPPNEFYREVARNDNWVSTLLCAAQSLSGGYGSSSTTSTNYGSGYQYAISSDQRGSCS